jgi:hypothetical protein
MAIPLLLSQTVNVAGAPIGASAQHVHGFDLRLVGQEIEVFRFDPDQESRIFSSQQSIGR